MCFSEIIHGNLKLRTACILLGIASIIFYGVLNAVAIVFLIKSSSDYALEHKPKEHGGSKIVLDAIFGGALAAGSIMFLASMLLLIGIKKNKPGLVLAYYSCGVMMMIVTSLGALLEVVHSYWSIALGQMIFVFLYIPCLVMVHSVYDLILRDLESEDNHNRLLEEVSPIDGVSEND